jgi:hypothetical protein
MSKWVRNLILDVLRVYEGSKEIFETREIKEVGYTYHNALFLHGDSCSGGEDEIGAGNNSRFALARVKRMAGIV